MTSKHFAHYLDHQIVDIQSLQTPHEDVQDITNQACIPWKVTPLQFHTLNEIRIWDIAMHRPILCVEIRSMLYVIGGFRTWNIVMAYHQKNNTLSHVPVQIIRRKMNKNQRREIAASSLLLTLISQSLGMHTDKHIGHIWKSTKTLAPDLYEHFFKLRSSTESRLLREFKKTVKVSHASKEKTQ